MEQVVLGFKGLMCEMTDADCSYTAFLSIGRRLPNISAAARTAMVIIGCGS